jgi:hypothetical protein
MHVRKLPRFVATLLAILAAAVVITSARAQGMTVEIIRAAPLPKDALFTQTVLWIAETIRSPRSVIQFQDRDLGTIVGNGSYDMSIDGGFLPFLSPVNVPVSYKVRIDVRDNRYRMTFSDVRLYLDAAPRALDYTDRDSTERRAREHFEQLANSLDQYLARPRDDF